MIHTLFDFIMHLDVHLTQLTAEYGLLMYFILFLIIFMETGFVVTPFLPGDSLLFAAGAIAALPGSELKIEIVWGLLVMASFLGDTTNYHLGRWIGPKVFSMDFKFLLNKKHLQRAHDFYEKNGSKTIFFARFLPIFRTFAPFVAGIAQMPRKAFLTMSLLGSLAWMTSLLGGGYFFGNNSYVKSNFHIVIFAVIIISFLPVAYGFIKSRLAK